MTLLTWDVSDAASVNLQRATRRYGSAQAKLLHLATVAAATAGRKVTRDSRIDDQTEGSTGKHGRRCQRNETRGSGVVSDWNRSKSDRRIERRGAGDVNALTGELVNFGWLTVPERESSIRGADSADASGGESESEDGLEVLTNDGHLIATFWLSVLLVTMHLSDVLPRFSWHRVARYDAPPSNQRAKRWTQSKDTDTPVFTIFNQTALLA